MAATTRTISQGALNAPTNGSRMIEAARPARYGFLREPIRSDRTPPAGAERMITRVVMLDTSEAWASDMPRTEFRKVGM